jgi:hypothetical protein
MGGLDDGRQPSRGESLFTGSAAAEEEHHLNVGRCRDRSNARRSGLRT